MDDEALKARLRAGFDGLVATAGDDPRKLCAVAEVAGDLGLPERRFALAARAQALSPGDPEIARLSHAQIAGTVPDWHSGMLRDEARNAAFDAAIRAAVRPGDRVLDIGAGSGLLAMMAARAGAATVVSCEANPALAQVAAEIVARNGFADRVRVVAKKSTALDPDTDMGGKADIVVAEVFGDNLLNEGALATFQDASRRLLAPGGRTIPARASMMVALAGWSGGNRFGDVAGFDLAPFNRVLPASLAIKPGDVRLSLQSEAKPILTFDLARGPWDAVDAHVELATDGGPVDGLAQWIRLDLDDTTTYENRPGPGATSHWAVRLYPLDTPAAPDPEIGMRIGATCRGTAVHLWLDDRAR